MVMTGAALLRSPPPTSEIVSTCQPALAVPPSVASRQRARRVLPANLAVSVRLTMVSTKAPELPVQAWRPAKSLRLLGFPVLEIVPL